VLASIVDRIVAVAVCAAVVSPGTPRPLAGAPGASTGARDTVATARAEAPVAVAAAPYTLRDAIPMAGFVAAPPDTGDDDFFLPPETDKKKLVRDVTVFLIVSVFVAYFIIKVFIEKDKETPPPAPNGKPVPTPGQ
jgi:hypothetical protein